MATKPRWQIIKEAQQAAGKTNISAAEFVKTTPVNSSGMAALVNAVKAQQSVQPEQAPKAAGMGQLLANQTENPEAARAAFNAAVAPVVEPTKRQYSMSAPKAEQPTAAAPMLPVSARGANAGILPENIYRETPKVTPLAAAQSPAQSMSLPTPISGGIGQAQLSPAQISLPELSVDQLAAMSPIDQMKYTAQYEQQQAMQVGQAQISPLQQTVQKYDNEIQQLEQQAQQALDLTPEQKVEMDELKVSIERDKKIAIEQAQKNAERAKQTVNDVLSQRGFGRSTMRADKLAGIEADLAADIATIETNASRRLKDVEVSMLASNKALVQEIQDRIEKKETERDRVQLQLVEKTGEMMKTILEVSPNNPVKIMEAVQKAREFELKEAAFNLDMMKFEASEKKEFVNQMTNALKWGVDTMGSDFINQMGDQELSFFASVTGIPIDKMKGALLTQAEQKMLFDQMKFETERQDRFALKDIDMQFDKEMRLLDFDLDSQKMLNQAEINLQSFVAENSWKNENEALSAFKSLSSLGLISDAYSGMASGVAGGGAYYDFPAPVAHPNSEVNIPVVETNSKIANFFPQNYNFVKDLPSNATNLAGHCAWFAQQIVNLPKVGNSLQEKITKLTSQVKKGEAFLRGEQEVKVGYTILTNESRQYGHIMVVNSKTPDGKLVITEANRQGTRQVTHDRIVDPNDPMIIGVFKTVPLDELKETATNIGAVAGGVAKDVYSMYSSMGSDAAGLFAGLGRFLTTQGARQVGYASPPKTTFDSANPLLKQIANGTLPEDMQKDILKNIMAASKGGLLDPQSAAEINAAFAAGAEQKKVNGAVAKLTDSEQKTIKTFSTSINAEKQLDKIPLAKQTQVNNTLTEWLRRNGGSDGPGMLGSVLAELKNSGQITEEEQLLMAAKGQWMEANLRLESGAAISVGEFLTKDLQWFPQYGESEATAQWKKDSRINTLYTTAQVFPQYKQFLTTENAAYADSLFQKLNDPVSYYETLATGGGSSVDFNKY